MSVRKPVPVVQVDRFTRRYTLCQADALALQKWALKRGYVAQIRPAGADRLTVMVQRQDGWDRSAKVVRTRSRKGRR